MNDDEDIPEAKGYDYTHCDCPNCGEALEFENDCRGETRVCDTCQTEFMIV